MCEAGGHYPVSVHRGDKERSQVEGVLEREMIGAERGEQRNSKSWSQAGQVQGPLRNMTRLLDLLD